jgi:rhodanese-related sulfurtransferase
VGSPLSGALGSGDSAIGFRGAAAYLNCKINVTSRGYVTGRDATIGRYSDLVASDLTPAQVAELHDRGAIELIDVRQPSERVVGRIPGDRHIELTQLPGAADAVARDRPVVFYCRSGHRSALATEAFRTAGYDAHNMAGGLIDWHAAGLPLVPEGGRVA